MKRKFKISGTALKWALLSGLVCSVFFSLAQFNAACDDLRTNVLRLHIIANSDSPIDQELKLKVRDSILESSSELFSGTENIDTAVIRAEERLNEFEKIAETAVKENGFNYGAKVKVGTSYFETREYEDFTLPAGEYPSLIITLGEGEGKNWWCVIFPEICIPAAMKEASLTDTVDSDSAVVAEEPQRYIMRFKIVEIYENLKKSFK